MRLPAPTQISTDPAVNDGAMAWAQTLADGLAQIRISAVLIGTGTLTWGGGGLYSNGLTVTHNMGIVPSIVLFCNTQSGVVQHISYILQAASRTTFQVQGLSLDPNIGIPAAGNTGIFNYFAAG